MGDTIALPPLPPSKREGVSTPPSKRQNRKSLPNLNDLGQTSRSPSPSKLNKRISFPNGSMASLLSEEDEIRSALSSPNLTPTQLRQISKSPLAKRLHIVSSSPNAKKYVIPVPLTLKLPPKLSSNPNPNSNSNSNSSPKSSPNSNSSPSSSKCNNDNAKYNIANTSYKDAGAPATLLLNSTSYNPSKSQPMTPKFHNKVKQPTLVYTPHGYEKVELTSSSSDDEIDYTITMEEIKPALPEKPSSPKRLSNQPPPVAHNNIKSSKIAFANKEADELSVIEEMSHAGSRSSSIQNRNISSESKKYSTHKKSPSKILPPLPSLSSKPNKNTKQEQHEKQEQQEQQEQQQHMLSLSSPVSTTTTKSSTFVANETLKPAVVINPNSSDTKHGRTSRLNSSFSLSPSPTTELLATSGKNMGSSTNSSPFSNSDPFGPSSKAQQNTSRLSKQYDSQQTRGRFFSDESHVSSVSSFSSAGDFGNFLRHQAKATTNLRQNHGHMQPSNLSAVLEKPLPMGTASGKVLQQRLVSNSSEASSTANSECSWNSLQRSIDISLSRETTSSPSRKLYNNPSKNEANTPKPQNRSEPKNDERSGRDYQGTSIAEKEAQDDEEYLWTDASESEVEFARAVTAPLKLTRKIPSFENQVSTDERATSSPEKSKNIEIQSQNEKKKENEEDEKEEEDKEEGDGMSYSFPNNSLNITNNKELRNRNIDDETRSYASRQSIFSNGQISIPDLSNKSIMMEQLSSKAPSSYNETLFSERHTETSVSEFGEPHPQQGHFRVPSKAALDHLMSQVKLHTTTDTDKNNNNNNNNENSELDSDEDTDFYKTSFENQQIKRAPSLNRSPVRHRRGKSMHSINFPVNQELSINNCSASAIAQHNRSKSADLLNIAAMRRSHQRTNSFDALTKIKSMQLQGQQGPKNNIENCDKQAQISCEEQSQINSEKAEAVAEVMNIKVTEPPKAVNYAVDFKESHLKDDDFGNLYAPPDVRVQPRSSNKSRGLIMGKTKNRSRVKASKVRGLADNENLSETESIVIDLTDEKVFKYTIQRKDSTISYRSTTENLNGKEVEVVLVDDDEEDDNNNNNNNNSNENKSVTTAVKYRENGKIRVEKAKEKEIEVAEVDAEDDDDEFDLSSLYSKYRNNTWLFGRDPQSSRLPLSTNTTACSKQYDPKSNGKDTVSSKKFIFKGSPRVEGDIKMNFSKKESRKNVDNRELNSSVKENKTKITTLSELPPRSLDVSSSTQQNRRVKRSNTTSSATASAKSRSVPERPLLDKRFSTSNMEDLYFDYTKDGNYNFESFLKELTAPKL